MRFIYYFSTAYGAHVSLWWMRYQISIDLNWRIGEMMLNRWMCASAIDLCFFECVAAIRTSYIFVNRMTFEYKYTNSNNNNDPLVLKRTVSNNYFHFFSSSLFVSFWCTGVKYESLSYTSFGFQPKKKFRSKITFYIVKKEFGTQNDPIPQQQQKKYIITSQKRYHGNKTNNKHEKVERLTKGNRPVHAC